MLACDANARVVNARGGAPVEYGDDCREVETPIEGTTRTPLGVTGADLLDALPSEGAGDAAWAPTEEEHEVPFTFGIAADEQRLRFVESTRVDAEPGGKAPAIYVQCSNHLAADAVLRLTSEAGGLDATLPVTFIMFQDEEEQEGTWQIVFSADVDAADLGADFDLEAFVDPANYETLSLFVSGTIREGVLSGDLIAQGTFSDGDFVGAENIEIVTFSGQGRSNAPSSDPSEASLP